VKIIAKVRDGWSPVLLVEATKEELSLISKGHLNDVPRGGYEVGAEIHVGKHWQRVRDIDDAQRRLDNAAQSIRAVADLLGTIDVVVPPTPERQEGGGK